MCQAARRGYASGSHETAKSGGDALWSAAALAVTLPSCWWILSSSSDSHGDGSHGGHSKPHAEGHGKPKEEEPANNAAAKNEEKSDEGSEKEDAGEKSEDSDSSDEKELDTPDTSEDESDDKNTKKHTPDAKGGSKKRLESKNAIVAGKEEEEGTPTDKPAASKTAGKQDSQTGKQEGLTNTDSKHSYDITNDPTKSKKGEGAPDTAKLKGTVDPKRAQA